MFINKPPCPRLVAALALLLGVVFCGCAPGGGSTATQVAARVNDSEITVHQIAFQMSGAQSMGLGLALTPPGPVPVREEERVLEQLIDQELLVQAALAQKLDRNPDILAELEAARRAVLARTYLQGISASTGAPAEADIRAYLNAHPALFAERRVYTLRELVFEATPGAGAGALEERLRVLWNGAHRWEVLAAAVEEADAARWSEVTRVVAAEQLPLDKVEEMHALAQGDLRFLRDGDKLVVQQVLRAQREPMNDEQAHRLVQAYLREAAQQRAEGAELARLRGIARIERIGDYATQPAPAGGAARPPATLAPRSQLPQPLRLARRDRATAQPEGNSPT